MRSSVNHCVVYLLSCAIVVVAASPPRVQGKGTLSRGERTAAEAAALDGPYGGKASSDGRGAGYFRAAPADTTGYEFPEEEEKRNLVREVALWVVVSAFVAFFIIEVFLRGDTDEPPPDKPGKQVPTASPVVPRPSGRSP